MSNKILPLGAGIFIMIAAQKSYLSPPFSMRSVCKLTTIPHRFLSQTAWIGAILDGAFSQTSPHSRCLRHRIKAFAGFPFIRDAKQRALCRFTLRRRIF
jgi:hypothetical protein